jgi:hypothetical protein
MNLGQSVLAILALVVITYLVISANRMVTQSLQDELVGEAYNQAGEIANDVINEALKKKFDDPKVLHRFFDWNSFSYKYYYIYDNNMYESSTSNFTAPPLGPTGTEKTTVTLPDRAPFKSISGYDDFDDYNNYQRIVDTPVMTGFVVNCTVSYVSSSDLTTPVTSATYIKRLVVKVSQPKYLTDTLSFSTIMTY